MIDAIANGVQQIVTEGAANFGAWVPSISRRRGAVRVA